MLKEIFRKFFMVAVLVFTAIFMFSAFSANSDYPQFQQKVARTVPEKIKLVDNYQEKYFEIIKRNNILLQDEDTAELNNDRKELDNLFAEVETQITNKSYLKKYKNIQNRFSEGKGETTADMNEFADKNYRAVDRLLNNVYKKAKSKIASEDLEKFILNQKDWLKEVEDYEKVYNSMGFGTIGTIMYYGYQINMKEFRTLLLMLYL